MWIISMGLRDDYDKILLGFKKYYRVYEHMLLMMVYYVAYDNLNIYYAYDVKIALGFKR